MNERTRIDRALSLIVTVVTRPQFEIVDKNVDWLCANENIMIEIVVVRVNLLRS